MSDFNVNINEPVEIRVINILGETVLIQNGNAGVNTFDVSSLAPGTYYVLAGNNTSGQLVVVK